MRGGGTKNATDFTTGLVKSDLERVDIRSLADVSKPGFSAVGEDGDNNGGDDAPP